MQRPYHRPFAGHGRPARQRGAVAILVALALVVLVGFVGLAIDGGHLYLTKTELQNSADACALAASNELTTLTSTNYSKAEAAGQTVALRNKVNFQGSAIVAGNVSVSFGADLKTGTTWQTASAAGSATSPPRYVRCTLTRPGIAMFFMQVLGFGSQTVASLATAGLVASQGSCAMPVGVCTNGSTTAPFGLMATDSLTYESGTKKWIWIGINEKTTPSDFTNFLAGSGGACSVVVNTTKAGRTKSSGVAPVNAWNNHFGTTYDANGQVVVALIIDCDALTKKDSTNVLAFGCVRMPRPLSSKQDNTITYEGLVSTAGSPCVSSSIPGGPSSSGSLVPALVQ